MTNIVLKISIPKYIYDMIVELGIIDADIEQIENAIKCGEIVSEKEMYSVTPLPQSNLPQRTYEIRCNRKCLCQTCAREKCPKCGGLGCIPCESCSEYIDGRKSNASNALDALEQ